MKISTSILNTKDKYNSIIQLNNTDTNYIHLDIMDGIFVSNKKFTIEEINKISLITKKPLDVHLMVSDPLKYINNIKNFSNINNITFHIEINQDISKIISTIKKLNIKCGIAINPSTQIDKIIPYLKNIDIVLIMSVNPGYGGQEFIDITHKIKEISKYNKQNSFIIEVDGGINNLNIKRIKEAGATTFVVGSFITNGNYEERIKILKQSL